MKRKKNVLNTACFINVIVKECNIQINELNSLLLE